LPQLIGDAIVPMLEHRHVGEILKEIESKFYRALAIALCSVRREERGRNHV
jgi:hypothetical protein